MGYGILGQKMKGKENEEREWLTALAVGDIEAFGILYEKYHRALYHFALKLSKNSHTAEDIVQSVFVSVWEMRQSIDPEQSFHAFLFNIARNRFYDMLRKRVVERCYVDYMLQMNKHENDDELEKQIEDREFAEIVNKLLQQVPERRLEIYRMSREENLSYKEIAEKLQISENTVDTQIRNVLNFLRKELPKYYR